MKKKILSIVLALTMTAALLAGCKDKEKSAAADSPAAETESAEEASSGEEKASEEDAPAEENAAAGDAGDNAEAAAEAAPAGGSDIVLGISFGQNVHPFFKAMQKGAETAAGELGVELVVQSADGSIEKQVTQIENLAQRGVKGILLNPYDSQGVAPAVTEALDKGIGVFTMDIDVEGAKSTSYVASDNVKIGELLAQYVDEQLGGRGKIAMIGDPAVTSLKDREQGFLGYIEKTDIEVVANQVGAQQRADSLNAAETILQAHPDIQAFVGINENSALGISSAIASAGLEGIIVTGVDSTNDIMNAIKDGTLAIGVAQDPYQMGYLSVQNAVKWINGESVEEVIKLDCEYMTPENIDKYIEREAQYNE